ncbi:MAG: HlyC/CorC family transporter [Coriobacteriia bacterium]|nr:HlyC/CorC family transporter [Coriobacteriia bacterium]MBS5477446.1 HlyC/CorC family transporter [Coriobacteriia bacterium]
MGIGISIVVSFLLILANGYFSMSEMALVNASKPLLDHDAEEGDKKAARAAELSSDSGQFLATIQVVITLVGFFASAMASTNLSDPLTKAIQSWGIGWLSAIAPGLSPILITLVVSYFSIVIGELVPKRIALASPEKTAKSVAGPLLFFKKLMAPLVWLTSASANGLATLLRIKSADENQVSEEELKYMVAEQDDLSDDEKRMIHDVFDLGDAIAREVMVPRVDVTAVEDTDAVQDVLKLMNETGFSRMPVYHEDIDQVVGVVNIKDLIAPALHGKGGDAVKEHMRPGIFVPDTKDLVPLLSEMKSKRNQMAIVVDEYGGTAGVITIEDIVEEIVGEIEDEYDPDNRSITKVSDREWVVEGAYPTDDAVELGWPIEESDEYETIAGWLMDEVDSLPREGDVYERDGWTFAVTKMDGRRIARVRVTAPEPGSAEGGDDASGEDGDGSGPAAGLRKLTQRLTASDEEDESDKR